MDPDPAGGGLPQIPSDCDPTVAGSPTPLRRLARVEYENALRQLLAPAGLESELVAIESVLAQLPPDGEDGEVFTQMDQRVTQRHLDAYYEVADALATRLSADSTRLRALAGGCAAEPTPTSNCVGDFISRFGRRVMRRPLTPEERSRYASLSMPGQAGHQIFRDLVFAFLLSPEFLYRLETEGQEKERQRLALTPHEIAARLSFLFWRAPPDDPLLEAADSGALDTEAGYAESVDRVFGDPRTRDTIAAFFGEWLGLVGFAGFVDTPAFHAFRGKTPVNEALHDAMTTEVYGLINHHTWESDGTYSDLLQSPVVVTRSTELAALYGIPPWNGTGKAPSLPTTQRSGLLTRAALLVEGNQLTNPIQRGAFLLRRVLCREISPPANLPAEALALPPPDPTRSTRQRFEAKTSPGECMGCHATINPLGFALEAYDALGRYQTQERIFGDDGALLAEVPVKLEVELVLDGQRRPVAGPVELSRALAESPEARECFARQYFRFSHRRHESAEDACVLEALSTPSVTGEPMRDTLRRVARLPSFRMRILEAP